MSAVWSVSSKSSRFEYDVYKSRKMWVNIVGTINLDCQSLIV